MLTDFGPISVNIDYHNLSDLQFEELVIEFCVELLGPSVKGFVTGQDGGRDARFVGQTLFRSDWNGQVVVQAKHTEMMNRSFSEAAFSGDNESSILGKELPRIRQLIVAGELDYYMLFSNRRLTGVTDEVLRKRIASETVLGKDDIQLYDTSELDRLVKRYPAAVERADLNPAKSPADVDPQQLAEVITALAQYKQEINELMEGTESPPEQRITPEQKNKAKGLRAEYFRKQIRPRIVDFPAIRQFLGHPDNQPYVRLYEDTATELEAKLDAWADPDVPFERALEVLIERLFARDVDLRSHRSLTRSVVFYMYCNCDIVKDVE